MRIYPVFKRTLYFLLSLTVTHMLQNPDVFIIKIGKFLRKTSLDELPQNK